MISRATILIIITVLVWAGVDLWLFMTEQPTISDVIFDVSQHAKALIFAAGFLCGHWFWGYPCKCDKEG